jgi:hypothetical protein
MERYFFVEAKAFPFSV